MVLPIIGGAALLGFIAWGKEFLGVKLYKQILTVIILLSIGLIGYFIYKMYKTKEKVEDIIKDGYMWIFSGGAKEKAAETLVKAPGWDELPELSKDIVLSGETVSEMFGLSAYDTGHEVAQKTYVDFQERFGNETAERYEDLNPVGRTLVSLGDYLTFGKATELGFKTRETYNKLFNK